jgi:hypothetical protein
MDCQWRSLPQLGYPNLNFCLFERTPINQFFEKQNYKFKEQYIYNQLKLFDL